jgi:septum formation topological specificity factor MinE
MQTSKLGREMDWLLDQWQTTSAEDRLKLVVAKIRQEEKLLQEPSKRVG